jgi:hypothetical protein
VLERAKEYQQMLVLTPQQALAQLVAAVEQPRATPLQTVLAEAERSDYSTG